MSDFTERAREMLAPVLAFSGGPLFGAARDKLEVELAALLAREAAMRDAAQALIKLAYALESDAYVECLANELSALEAAIAPAPSVPSQPGEELPKAAGELPVMMTAVRHAWTGDKKKAAAYIELAASKLDAVGDLRARYVRTMLAELQGEREPQFVHALAQPVEAPAPDTVPVPRVVAWGGGRAPYRFLRVILDDTPTEHEYVPREAPAPQPPAEREAPAVPLLDMGDDELMSLALGWREHDAPEGLGPVDRMVYGACRCVVHAMRAKATAALTAAREAGRREGIEEAARDLREALRSKYSSATAEELLAAIRALPVKDGGHG